VTTAGLLAALLGGVILLVPSVVLSKGLSGRQFHRGERHFATILGGALGVALVFTSLLILAAPPDGAPDPSMRPLSLVTGAVSVLAGILWAVNFNTFIAWSIRREPTILGGEGWQAYPRWLWRVMWWLPAVLLVVGGVTLIVTPVPRVA
jgi:hypothetical protein